MMDKSPYKKYSGSSGRQDIQARNVPAQTSRNPQKSKDDKETLETLLSILSICLLYLSILSPILGAMLNKGMENFKARHEEKESRQTKEQTHASSGGNYPLHYSLDSLRQKECGNHTMELFFQGGHLTVICGKKQWDYRGYVHELESVDVVCASKNIDASHVAGLCKDNSNHLHE